MEEVDSRTLKLAITDASGLNGALSDRAVQFVESARQPALPGLFLMAWAGASLIFNLIWLMFGLGTPNRL